MKSDYEYFVCDEGDGVYNIFPYDDFDDDGWHNLHQQEDGYHISDFDIVYETNDFQDACDWVDRKNGYEV